MIIKSLGRKASEKLVGGRVGRQPFSNLVRYMTRSNEKEKSQSVLWHGFYGHAGMSDAEIIAAFEQNARLLKERKNGNILYHEILSFSAGYKLEGEALARAVADIGQEYLRMRAPNQMAFGAIHWDTDHIHLHLMISANEVGKSERVWLTKEEFSQIQKVVEAFTLARYPELAQQRIYDRTERKRERVKTQVHEQAMKSRTNQPSRRETLKAKLHSLFASARTARELYEMLEAHKIELYTRGKSVGVIVPDIDGKARRYRLATLGLMEHFEEIQKRMGVTPSVAKQPEQKSRRKATVLEAFAKEFLTGQPQPELRKQKKPGQKAPKERWTIKRETANLFREFVTGKLQPDWHKKVWPNDRVWGKVVDTPQIKRSRAQIIFREFLTGKLQPDRHDHEDKPAEAEQAKQRRQWEMSFWEFLSGELNEEWHGPITLDDEVKFGPDGQWGEAPRAWWRVAASEMLTGQLQSEWHEPEPAPRKQPGYMDEILRAARKRDAQRRRAPDKEPDKEPDKDRGDEDSER